MKECNVPDPVRFRAQATGIGSTRGASEATGRGRAQRVIDCAPAEQRKHAVGYPAPTPDELCYSSAAIVAVRRSSLRR